MYNYILNAIYKFPLYYVLFFGTLGIIFLLEFIQINENLLIGTLFTIGTLTVLQYIRFLYIKISIDLLNDLKVKYILRKTLIYKYKFYFLKLIFFYLIYFLKIRTILINFKFEKLLLINFFKFNVFEYSLIFIQLVYKNLLNFFLNNEQLVNLELWFNSIKVAYLKLI